MTVRVPEFHPDDEVPAETFIVEGEISTEWHDERRRDRVGDGWLNSQTLPMPRWWPSGVGYTTLEGDPETEAFSVDLEVPGMPGFARWRLGDEPPRRWQVRAEHRHVHRWSDDTWEWGLAVSEPLSDEDLARVIASMPQRRRQTVGGFA